MSGWRTAGQSDHPTRLAIVEAIEEVGQPCSAASLARRLELDPATVNYHVKVLVGRGRLTLIETRRRRNAQEQLYGIVP
jgi:DNA-binding transcriptional ArsR family regulator